MCAFEFLKVIVALILTDLKFNERTIYLIFANNYRERIRVVTNDGL